MGVENSQMHWRLGEAAVQAIMCQLFVQAHIGSAAATTAPLGRIAVATAITIRPAAATAAVGAIITLAAAITITRTAVVATTTAARITTMGTAEPGVSLHEIVCSWHRIVMRISRNWLDDPKFVYDRVRVSELHLTTTCLVQESHQRSVAL